MCSHLLVVATFKSIAASSWYSITPWHLGKKLLLSWLLQHENKWTTNGDAQSGLLFVPTPHIHALILVWEWMNPKLSSPIQFGAHQFGKVAAWDASERAIQSDEALKYSSSHDYRRVSLLHFCMHYWSGLVPGLRQAQTEDLLRGKSEGALCWPNMVTDNTAHTRHSEHHSESKKGCFPNILVPLWK